MNFKFILNNTFKTESACFSSVMWRTTQMFNIGYLGKLPCCFPENQFVRFFLTKISCLRLILNVLCLYGMFAVKLKEKKTDLIPLHCTLYVSSYRKSFFISWLLCCDLTLRYLHEVLPKLSHFNKNNQYACHVGQLDFFVGLFSPRISSKSTRR